MEERTDGILCRYLLTATEIAIGLLFVRGTPEVARCGPVRGRGQHRAEALFLRS